jgi:hypothetical protein
MIHQRSLRHVEARTWRGQLARQKRSIHGAIRSA